MWARLAVIAAVIALGATGCTSGGQHPAPYNPSDARAVFGDFATVDPCSLLDLAALPSSLDASRQPSVSLDGCTLTVEVAGRPASAYVGELLNSTDKNLTDGQQVAGGLTLYPDTLSDGLCFAYLRFPVDPMYLGVLVSPQNNTQATDGLCTASQDIAKNVATVVAQHPAGHLADVPENSLSRVNACGTIDNSALASAGLGAPVTFPAEHQCIWRKPSDTVDEYAQLTMNVGPSAGSGGTATVIAGRPSVVRPNNGSGYGSCVIQTAGIAFGSPQQHQVEVADMYVFGPSGSAACQLATTLAGVAWPHLPTS